MFCGICLGGWMGQAVVDRACKSCSCCHQMCWCHFACEQRALFPHATVSVFCGCAGWKSALWSWMTIALRSKCQLSFRAKPQSVLEVFSLLSLKYKLETSKTSVWSLSKMSELQKFMSISFFLLLICKGYRDYEGYRHPSCGPLQSWTLIIKSNVYIPEHRLFFFFERIWHPASYMCGTAVIVAPHSFNIFGTDCLSRLESPLFDWWVPSLQK